jgi:hypothetical protein
MAKEWADPRTCVDVVKAALSDLVVLTGPFLHSFDIFSGMHTTSAHDG